MAIPFMLTAAVVNENEIFKVSGAGVLLRR
jgi:hypothetical protein